jgi:riboflavin kinase/FMN adenylyltransferase
VIWRGLEEVPPGTRAAVTIGVFDGVHRGHQALMRKVVEQAERDGATPVVVTFDRHPMEVVAPERAPMLLSTLEQRARAMGAVGIEAVIVLKFDEEFRTWSPEEFVRRVLVDGLGCVHVVVGANFKFGHNQSGTIETLSDLSHAYGFGVTIFALQMEGEDEVVSSSLIRRHVAEGRVERVAEELDRPYTVEGVVEHGAKRGRDLGFPTANLRVPERILLPRLGVYAGWMRWRGARYPVVMNVGVNPTFGDRETPILEVHVLDFDENLYDETVEIDFTHRLRDEMKFEGAEPLVRQMRDDVKRARELLGV